MSKDLGIWPKIEKESGLGFVVNVFPPSGKGQSFISANLGVL